MGTTPPDQASHRTVDHKQPQGMLRAGQYRVPVGVATLGLLLTLCGSWYVGFLATSTSSPGHELRASRDGSAMWFILIVGLLFTALVTVCLLVVVRRSRQSGTADETSCQAGNVTSRATKDAAARFGRTTYLPGPEAIPPRFRLLEDMPAAVFFYDTDFRLLWMNRFARGIARINGIDYVNQPCYAVWGKSSIPCVRCPMRPESMEKGEPLAIHEFSTADGRRWSMLAYPVCDDDGGIWGVMKMGRDISERVAASMLLERERATFERILDQNPSSIAVFTPAGRFVRANPAFFRLFGLPGYGAPQSDYSLFDDPILLENGLEEELGQLRSGQAVDIPAVRYNASRLCPEALDRTVFVGARAYPIFDGDGEIESIILAHEDLTRRDQIERELQTSQERLALALDPSMEGLWDFDVAQGKVNYLSPRWFTMLGWGPREFPHTYETWVQLLHPEDRLWAEQIGGAMLREGIVKSYEYRMAHKDGGYRWISTRGRIVKRDANGAPLRMIGIHVDITARKEAEARIQELQAQLAHASRLSTMGELAAGFAHELNQPLTAIASYARAAMRNVEAKRVDASRLCETLKKISQQAERAGAVIRSLRGYVRPVSSSAQSSYRTDVNECAREAAQLLSHETQRHNIRIRLSLGTDLSDVSIGRIELVQVFVNLVLNAIEALASTKHKNRELSIQTATLDQGRIEVKVADNGPGLSRATAEQIFEPFITTKPDGMGVGLAICRRILESHGGELSATNNDSGGAVFTFSLCYAHGRNTYDN